MLNIKKKRIISKFPRKVQFVLLCISFIASIICVENLAFVYLSSTESEYARKDGIQSKLVNSNTNRQKTVLGVLEEYNESGGFSGQKRVLHPYLGYVKNHLPGSSYNIYGFMGPEPVQKRSDDKFIIGLFGGSVAQEFYLQAGDYFIQQLKQYPEFIDKRIIFVPITQAGYKQPQHALAFSYFLSLGAEFDMVIVLDGVNELIISTENTRDFGITPSYPLDWLALSQAGITPSIAVPVYVGQNLSVLRQSIKQFMAISFLRNSSILLLLWDAFDQRLEYQLFVLDRMVRTNLSSGTLSYQTRGFSQHVETMREHFLQLALLWSRSSRQMYDLASGNGIRYYHFLQPSQYALASKTLSAEELDHAYLAEENSQGSILKQGYPYLQEEGQKLKKDGLHYTDLSNIFLPVTDTIYIDTCCHMNMQGNTRMADAIIADIVK
jgi:hypothetical protein